jgi:hypothetical protein
MEEAVLHVPSSEPASHSSFLAGECVHPALSECLLVKDCCTRVACRTSRSRTICPLEELKSKWEGGDRALG